MEIATFFSLIARFQVSMARLAMEDQKNGDYTPYPDSIAIEVKR
jgi:hypothetical protein